jgi:hypothetical protein
MDEAIPAWRQVSGAMLRAGAEKMMPAVRIAAMLCLVLAAACARAEVPPGVMAQAGSPMADPSLAAPNQDKAVVAEPPLDVAALKARLRDTDAIGVFTKLALKNQVDDLLKRFRAHYLNGQKTSVAALRQPYDMLVLKVLALVQDSDPSLARTIAGSREAIWGILADPNKFKSVS